MDGKVRFFPSRDHAAHNPAGQRINIFVERLWRTQKYECVYLYARESGSEAKEGIRKRIDYNHKRLHSSLGGRPPVVVYWHRIEPSNHDTQLKVEIFWRLLSLNLRERS